MWLLWGAFQIPPASAAQQKQYNGYQQAACISSYINQKKQPPSQPFDKVIRKSSLQILVGLLFNGHLPGHVQKQRLVSYSAL